MREAIREAATSLSDFVEWQPTFNLQMNQREWNKDQEKAQSALDKLKPFTTP
jgi:hypothetical protein